MKKVVFISLLMLLTTALFAQSAEEQVWQRVEALTKAIFETKDSAALWALVSDKVSYGHSSGVVEDKPTMVSKAVGNKAVYKNQSLEKGSVTFAAKTAIVRHNFRAIIVENGKEAPVDIGVLHVWSKERKEWKLLARQAVKIPPKS